MDPSALQPGDEHYLAYVGPPSQFDLMGATQFRLLCVLGLRAQHSMLDVGCGSLRAGKLLIPYLKPERYCGIDPNAWLIEDAITHELGRELIELKKPRFDHNADCDPHVFEQPFDFILSQSVFSHAPAALIRKALKNFRSSLKPGGLIAATFQEGGSDYAGDDWRYPDCVQYRPATIRAFAEEAELHVQRIPWFHPRQTWYLFAHDPGRLPHGAMLEALSGTVLFTPSFDDRWTGLPPREGVRQRLKSLFAKRS